MVTHEPGVATDARGQTSPHGPVVVETYELPHFDPRPDELYFLLAQLNFRLRTRPYIRHANPARTWTKIAEVLRLARDVAAPFCLFPEYSLPHRSIGDFLAFMRRGARNNSVVCMPVEHLRRDELRALGKRLGMGNAIFDAFPDLARAEAVDPVFNVAIVAVKGRDGKLTLAIQPKIYPAQLEEQRMLTPYRFIGGRGVRIFRSPTISFAASICFDFIGMSSRVPNAIEDWMDGAETNRQLDYLFVLQVNPSPLHRDFERSLHRCATHPAWRHTTFFFVNCDSRSAFPDHDSPKLRGFNSSNVIGRFKVDFTSEYEVQTQLQIADERRQGEVLSLGDFARLILTGDGERVVWLRARALRHYAEGPTYPRQNDVSVYTFGRGAKLRRLPLSVSVQREERVPPPQELTIRTITVAAPPVFVGRDTELATIEAFYRGASRSLLIYGEPGMGKSFLARQGASRIASSHPELRGCLWYSAKDRELTLAGVLRDFAVDVGSTYLRSLDEVEQRHEIVGMLQRTLTPSLLVFDNIETVRDRALLDFIGELTAVSKVILTSRDRDSFRADDILSLRELDDDAIRAMIRMHPFADRQALALLPPVVHGSPLKLNLLAAHLAANPDSDATAVVGDIRKSGGDVFAWLYGRATEEMGAGGEEVLPALSLFAGTFSQDAVRAIARTRGSVIVDQLARRQLIEPIEAAGGGGERFHIHPLTRRFVQDLKLQPSVVRGFVRYYEGFVDAATGEERYDDIEREIHNIERALELAAGAGDLAAAVRIADALYPYLYERGLWADAIELGAATYERRRELRQRAGAADAAARVSWCAYRKDDFPLAERWLGIARKEMARATRPLQRTRGLIDETQALIGVQTGRMKASAARTRIARVVRTFYDKLAGNAGLVLRARAITYQGELYMREHDYAGALRTFARVADLADQHSDHAAARKIEAWTRGNQGEALLASLDPANGDPRQYQACKQFFVKGLELARPIHRRHTMAVCTLGIGRTYLRLGHDDAPLYLAAAREMFDRLGKRSRLAEIDALRA